VIVDIGHRTGLGFVEPLLVLEHEPVLGPDTAHVRAPGPVKGLVSDIEERSGQDIVVNGTGLAGEIEDVTVDAVVDDQDAVVVVVVAAAAAAVGDCVGYVGWGN